MKDKPYICDKCGMMLSPADGPHKCPEVKHPVLGNGNTPAAELYKYEKTGQTIEEVRQEKVTIGDLRDAIIEAAVELVAAFLTSEESDGMNQLKYKVDAYHAALREQAREGT